MPGHPFCHGAKLGFVEPGLSAGKIPGEIVDEYPTAPGLACAGANLLCTGPFSTAAGRTLAETRPEGGAWLVRLVAARDDGNTPKTSGGRGVPGIHRRLSGRDVKVISPIRAC